VVYYVIKKMLDDVFWSHIKHHYFVVAVSAGDERTAKSVLQAKKLSDLPLPPACYAEYLTMFRFDCRPASPASSTLEYPVKEAFTLIVKRANKVLDEGEFKALLEKYIYDCQSGIKRLEAFMKTARNAVLRYPFIRYGYEVDAGRLRQAGYRTIRFGRPAFTEIVLLEAVGFIVAFEISQIQILLPYDAEEVDPEAVVEMDNTVKEQVSRDLAVAVEEVRRVLSRWSDPDLVRVLPVMEYALFLFEMLR